MIGFTFSKDVALSFARSIQSGESIQIPAEGWTANNLLMLAGASHFAAMSLGPQAYKTSLLKSLPKERREAVEESFFEDLAGAVEFIGDLTMKCVDGEFDERFHPSVQVIICGSTKSIQFGEGPK